MIETLAKICTLQRQYSPDNTPAMQERGRLIRQDLRDHITTMASDLRLALGDFGADFDTGASDGIGRKTEAPWVRYFAKSMSPDPRNGFYAVIHFAADGSAVFLTVGCGATTWVNNELRPLSDEDLLKKTKWARRVIIKRFGSIEPFDDQIDLGARAKLPRAFEKATATAKRVAVNDLDDAEVRVLLVSAAKQLGAIYDAQRLGRDLSAYEFVQNEVEQLARPNRPAGGQGLRVSHEERVAIEFRAMTVSRAWLESAGFSVTDTSKNCAFDFLAVKGSEELKIEVKGTTAEECSSIFMTRNEVELHRNEKGKTALLIVSGITLEKVKGAATAEGGTLTDLMRWDIDHWDAIPTAYQVRKKPQNNLPQQ